MALQSVNSAPRAPLLVKLRKMLTPKRSWFQFRIRTMLFAMTVVALAFNYPHVCRYYAFWRLRGYVGIDLRNLPEDEKQRVDDWVRVVVDEDADELPRDPRELFRRNWLLHESSLPESRSQMYVIRMQPMMFTPGSSYSQVHIIDRWGRLIRSFEFNVGYRAWPKTATFDDSRYGFACLTVEMEGMWSGKTRQFYRITDNHVELLRSERLDGTMEMGNGTLFDIAEKPEDWSNWRRLVASDDTLEQLRGLAAFWSYDNQENMGMVDETTQRRFEQLAKSDNSWIREEAAAAIQLLDDSGAVAP